MTQAVKGGNTDGVIEMNRFLAAQIASVLTASLFALSYGLFGA